MSGWGPPGLASLALLSGYTAGDKKGARMTEEQLPDQARYTDRNGDLPDQSPGVASSLERPVSEEPDNYPGTAQTNRDRGEDDPLLQDDTVSGEEEDFLSEQTLHDETHHATDVPTLEEAVADTEPGEIPTGEEARGRNDQADLGGSPLS
jgi:hypothetical protein